MQRRQIILIATLFATIVGVLALLYVAFLRPEYTVLYEDLREADAAEIVAELDKQGITYRLADSRRRILVPESEADRARVLIAGSGIAMGGVVGFELFNDADMGLTEFAEKVNYQRALQGELARTIMTMDGVAFARVHLSLPERTLFRAAKTGPKAAVTVQTPAGRALDLRQVEGIQRLVASAVAELPARDVAVLDAKGDLVSPTMPDSADGGALDERSALEAYYRARAQTAAQALLPGLPFEVRVMAQDRGLPSGSATDDTPPASGPDQVQERSFALRVALRTETDINEDNRALLRQALTAALALSPERGDVLRFETGVLTTAGDAAWNQPTARDSAPSAPGTAEARNTYPADPVTWLDRLFTGWALPAVAALGLGIWLILRRRARLSAQEQDAFADLLAGQLTLQKDNSHG